MILQFGIIISHVTSAVDAEGLQGFPPIFRAEKIVPAAHFIASGKIQGEDEIGDRHAVDFIMLTLDRIANLVPMKNVSARIFRVRAHDQEIHFRIGYQFQGFM